jgi:hypothetical protein
LVGGDSTGDTSGQTTADTNRQDARDAAAAGADPTGGNQSPDATANEQGISPAAANALDTSVGAPQGVFGTLSDATSPTQDQMNLLTGGPPNEVDPTQGPLFDPAHLFNPGGPGFDPATLAPGQAPGQDPNNPTAPDPNTPSGIPDNFGQLTPGTQSVAAAQSPAAAARAAGLSGGLSSISDILSGISPIGAALGGDLTPTAVPTTSFTQGNPQGVPTVANAQDPQAGLSFQDIMNTLPGADTAMQQAPTVAVGSLTGTSPALTGEPGLTPEQAAAQFGSPPTRDEFGNLIPGSAASTPAGLIGGAQPGATSVQTTNSTIGNQTIPGALDARLPSGLDANAPVGLGAPASAKMDTQNTAQVVIDKAAQAGEFGGQPAVPDTTQPNPPAAIADTTPPPAPAVSDNKVSPISDTSAPTPAPSGGGDTSITPEVADVLGNPSSDGAGGGSPAPGSSTEPVGNTSTPAGLAAQITQAIPQGPSGPSAPSGPSGPATPFLFPPVDAGGYNPNPAVTVLGNPEPPSGPQGLSSDALAALG